MGGLRRWARRSAQNAAELYRFGRLEPADQLPFAVVDQTRLCRLRRYSADAQDLPHAFSAPLLLIPPLMLTAEIYDVAPDASAVRVLCAAGVDAWVIDFGAPEREEGGMQRTLDDHVRAVAWAAGRVRDLTSRDVHLAGYSQGGMFAYQAAAYLRSRGVASVVTFGSPVDIHRSLPNVASDVTERLVRVVSPAVRVSLDRIEGIPGILTSVGFKMLSPRKELEQLFDFVGKLHDRQALARREGRRRFLAGEGFVAWPGPALRRFFDEFVVHNRLLSGGMVIDGRTVTLADITAPILAFVGDRDEFARPPSVRAIRRAAPQAEIHEIELAAGHFGLVVGSTAKSVTWPAVVDWLRWRDGGEMPAGFAEQRPVRLNDEPEEQFDPQIELELVTGAATDAIERVWLRTAEVFRGAGQTVDALRWQLPRLRRLERMTGSTRISPSLILAEQARAIGERTFFLWGGRAFSYADANARVDAVARGFIACGVRPGDRVAVAMASRPSLLSAVTALGRIGAVAVLLGEVGPAEAAGALAELAAAFVVCDPEGVHRARDLAPGCKILVLGGAGAGDERTFEGATDMEAIDPAEVALPSWYLADAGRARTIAMVLVRPGAHGPRLQRISNGRWAFSALGFAAAATLRPTDTVYSCLPLHHPTGILVATGGALVGGARLALSSFEPSRFWGEVRRYGATVVAYAGDMARPLCDAPPARGEKDHPARLFAGSGMRADVWRRLTERFGVGVLELYASTERNLVLANASGAKIGAVGRPLPGSSDLALCEFAEKNGQIAPVEPLKRATEGPGVALIRVGDHLRDPRVKEGVFDPGDRWFATADVLRRDADGDYWYLGKVDDLIATSAGVVPAARIEDALLRAPGVRLAVAYQLEEVGQSLSTAAVQAEALDIARLTDVARAELAPHERPRRILLVDRIPHGSAFRPDRRRLRAFGLTPPGLRATLRYDAAREAYVAQE